MRAIASEAAKVSSKRTPCKLEEIRPQKRYRMAGKMKQKTNISD